MGTWHAKIGLITYLTYSRNHITLLGHTEEAKRDATPTLNMIEMYGWSSGIGSCG